MWPNPQETVDLVTFTEEITSNINKVIRAVLNSILFFYKKISHAPKAPKAQKTQISE